MTRILMTGGGAPGAPGILKCLKKDNSLDIHLCDANPNATGRYLHPQFSVIPRADDPDFIPAIMKICLDKGIQLIMPLVTRELFHFAREKKKFESSGIRVLVSDEQALNTANNKSSLYKFLDKAGISVPAYHVVNTFSEFESAVKDLGYPEKRVCFKPSVSNGSRGFRIIDDQIDSYDLLFNYKPNSTFISYNEICGILQKKTFPELLVSEYLPGEEYSVDCLVDHGKCKLALPRLRSKMNNGISVEGEFIRNEEIILDSVRIVEAIGCHGNIGIQFKKAEDGQFKILEINPRVQGTIVAGLGAGINLPLLAVKQELGMDIRAEELNVQWGVKFSRFWDEVFYK